jgi:hypothetical protein
MAIGSRAGILAGQAYVSLGLFSGDFEKGLLGAQQKLDNLGGKLMNTFGKATLAIGAASVGFGMFFKKINDDTIQLYRMSKAMGVSVEFLSSLRYEAAQFNVKMEDIDSGLTQFRRRILQASLGSKEANETFSSLGVSWQEFAGLNPEKQILRLGEALNALPEGMRKASGAQVFGDVGRKVFPIFESFVKDSTKAQRDGVNVTKQQVESALVLQKVFTNLAASMNSFARDIMTTLGPTLMSLMKGVSGVSKGIREFALAHPDLVRNIFLGILAFGTFTATLWTLGVSLKVVSFGLGGLRSIFIDIPKAILSTIAPMKLFNFLLLATNKTISGMKIATLFTVGKLNRSSPQFAAQMIKNLPIIGPMIGGLSAAIGPIVAAVGPIVLLGIAITSIFGVLKNAPALIKGAFSIVGDLIKGIETLSKGAFSGIGKSVSLIMEGVTLAFSQGKWQALWDILKQGFVTVASYVKDVFSATFRLLVEIMKGSIFNSEFWKTNISAIFSMFIEGAYTMARVIGSVLDGLFAGFSRNVLGLLESKGGLLIGGWGAAKAMRAMGVGERSSFTAQEFKSQHESGIDPVTGLKYEMLSGKEYSDTMYDANGMLKEGAQKRYAMKSTTFEDIPKLTELFNKNEAIYADLIASNASDMKVITVKTEGQEVAETLARQTTADIATAVEVNRDIIAKAIKSASESDLTSMGVQSQAEYNKLENMVNALRIAPEKMPDEGLPPPSSMSLLKQTFETFGSFSAFRLGSMGVGSSVQEKIASGIDELVKGQEKTNDILGGMEAPAFGG